jgi:hypothetical protein
MSNAQVRVDRWAVLAKLEPAVPAKVPNPAP